MKSDEVMIGEAEVSQQADNQQRDHGEQNSDYEKVVDFQQGNVEESGELTVKSDKKYHECDLSDQYSEKIQQSEISQDGSKRTRVPKRSVPVHKSKTIWRAKDQAKTAHVLGKSKAIKKNQERQHECKLATGTKSQTLPVESLVTGAESSSAENHNLTRGISHSNQDSSLLTATQQTNTVRPVTNTGNQMDKAKQLDLIVHKLKSYLFDLTCLLPLARKASVTGSVSMPSLPFLFFFTEMLNTLHQQANNQSLQKFEAIIQPLLDQSGLTSNETHLAQGALQSNNLMTFATNLFVQQNSAQDSSNTKQFTLSALLRMQNKLASDLSVNTSTEDFEGMQIVQKIIDQSFSNTVQKREYSPC